MKAVGIVVEYNPFHNGHFFQAEQARKMTEADVVIAVMSGSFLQRGEPAIVSKWYRTEMALSSGIDLVIELPYIYSTQKAELFAHGAISLLAEMGVTFINFGSECGNIDQFNQLISFMIENKPTFDQFVKEKVKLGYSYPRATSEAFEKLKPSSSILSLSEPNNILGYHYMKAIKDQGRHIKPTTTLRKQAHYHDQTVSDKNIASATSIRKAIASKQFREIQHVMPEVPYRLLLHYQESFHLLHTWEHYYHLLQYKLLSTPVDQLQQIYECEEGLEYRMKETIKHSHSFADWMQQMKTKRYTWTRLQRLATHVLTNTTKIDMAEALSTEPTYIRLLGMNAKGQAYLNHTKKKREVPLVTKPAKLTGLAATLDERATNVYVTALSTEHRMKQMREEMTRPPLLLTN
ncbi:nucleotidyltransferase [Alkalihalobacillus sp. MEB130]|uniref:nucleotidyltransferase n=1 Tax=Alkalihalobacillus sp. MEB130 TaxID=2976704 RepID=UPI0028DE5D55|nr:nucleotidyltransferase [Alkalihalobacillus sp. MEB130]MDT8859138.1 nucleotidyltransferase [Alkalihalobacillus sp. MEB130]